MLMANNWTESADELREAHAALIETAAELKPELREQGGVCGHWSPKAVIAHLIGWDNELTYALTLYADGNGDTYQIIADGEAFNKRSVDARQYAKWDEIVAEVEGSHRALQAAIGRAESLNLDLDSGFGKAINGRIQDYRIHTDQLREWLTC